MALSTRQEAVKECVIDAYNEKKRPYTTNILKRMHIKGHTEVTLNQVAYDLGVIIRTEGTGIYSMRCDNDPALWIYDPKIAKTPSSEVIP